MDSPKDASKHRKPLNKKHLQLIIFLFHPSCKKQTNRRAKKMNLYRQLSAAFLWLSERFGVRPPPVCQLRGRKQTHSANCKCHKCWPSSDAQHTAGMSGWAGGGVALTCLSHTSWRPDQTGLWSMRWGFTSLMNWVWGRWLKVWRKRKWLKTNFN